MDLLGINQALAKLPAESQAVLQPIVEALDQQQKQLAALEDKIQNDLAADLGNFLSAFTAERQELINDLHGIIDRFNFSIQPRKETT